MKVLESRFVQDFIKMAQEGYEQGWHERNGGNLSYRIRSHEVEAIRDRFMDHGEWVPIGASVPDLKGEFFLVTGTGQFFRNIPVDLEEAAYVDGCGMLRTFTRVMLPQTKPIVTSCFLFAFVWQWTDGFYSKMFLGNVKLVSTGLARLVDSLSRSRIPTVFWRRER